MGEASHLLVQFLLPFCKYLLLAAVEHQVRYLLDLTLVAPDKVSTMTVSCVF